MVRKMSKKIAPLPSRPEPPTVEQIVEDIQSAKSDDIVYSILQHEPQNLDSPSTNISDSFSFDDSYIRNASPGSGSNDTMDSDSTESLYQKAVQFVTATDQLRTAPAELESRSEHLQRLGQELTEAIDNLKTQAHCVLDSSFTK